MTITELIEARIVAKRSEDEAAAKRRDIDAKIAAVLADASKQEGTVTQKVDGFKVSVTYKMTRSVDQELVEKEWAKMTDAQHAAFKWKADLSLAAFKKLDGTEQAGLSKYITTKPATASVSIEVA